MRFFHAFITKIRAIGCAFDGVLARTVVFDSLMIALLLGAMACAFWEVLPPNVIFLAPDAPWEAMTFQAAWTELFKPAPPFPTSSA